MLIIGCIGLKRTKTGKLVFYFEKNPAMWGGVASTSPIKENENNIKVFTKCLLGGPIASIIMGLLFLIAGIFSFDFLFLMGIMSFAIGVVCLIPMKNGLTYTDGKRLLRLRGGGQGKAEEIALFKIMEREQFKISIDNLRKEDFEALLIAKLPSYRYYGYYYLYKFYSNQSDSENMEKALAVLQSMKKDVPKVVIDECALDL